MRIVIQRVSQASILINNSITKNINNGIVILLGIEHEDQQEDIDWLCGKITKLRIFDDEQGVMNLSIQEIKGEILLVSQFTLHASTKKGNRPSYIKAARPETAIPLYNSFVETLATTTELKIETGEFGADMQIILTNNGPVTIIIDSKNKE
jgi:D-tyrosyl-tRNA(Tyr) deacylase